MNNISFLKHLRVPQDIGDESWDEREKRIRHASLAFRFCLCLIGIMVANLFIPILDLSMLPSSLGGLPLVVFIVLIIACINFSGSTMLAGHRTVFEMCLKQCGYETQASILIGYRVFTFYQISNLHPPESLITLAVAILESRDPSKEKVLYVFSNQSAWMCHVEPGIISAGGTLPFEIRSPNFRGTVEVRLPAFTEESVTYWLRQLFATTEYTRDLEDVHRLRRILEVL